MDSKSILFDKYNELLNIKIIPPIACCEIVPRPRLTKKISEDRKSLILVQAPAGFGKTTLLSSWLSSQSTASAWVSLDSSDNDPRIFLSYVVASVTKVFPNFAEKLSTLLSTYRIPNETAVAALLFRNLEAIKVPIILLLDDFHVIENRYILNVVNQLLLNLPRNVQLALASRTELKLPAIVKMQVNRQVCSINQIDLRFNENEIMDFIGSVTNLSLSENDLTILGKRTEGWIAGLQLASLSLEREADCSSFIQTFSGDDQMVAHYLTQEVLQRLPKDGKNFLLQVSILRRLSGPLCDYVLETNQCAKRLQNAAKGNMFLVSLDNQGVWFRFHHLFAGLLMSRLAQEIEIDTDRLHRRASEWYMQNGFPHEAMHHALVMIKDYSLALKVMTQYGRALSEDGQCATVLEWYEQIPREEIAKYPSRLLGYAWVRFLSKGDFKHDVIEELQEVLASNKTHLSDTERAYIEREVALIRGYEALRYARVDEANRLALTAIDSYPDTGNQGSYAGRLLMAGVYYAKNQLEDAEVSFASLLRDCMNVNYLITVPAAIAGYVRTLLAVGRVSDAKCQLEKIIDQLQQKGWDHYLPDYALIGLCQSAIAYQQNDLDACLEYLLMAKKYSSQDQWDAVQVLVELYLARLAIARGQMDVATEHLKNTIVTGVEPYVLTVFPCFADLLCEVNIGLENYQQAQRHIVTDYQSEALPPNTSQGRSLLSQVRILIYQRKFEEATHRLSIVSPNMGSGHYTMLGLKAALLDTILLYQRQNIDQACEQAKYVLNWSIQNNGTRIWLDDQKFLAPVLKELMKRDEGDIAFIEKLVAGMNHQNNEHVSKSEQDLPALTHLLSTKELEILHLLADGLTNKHIAAQQSVSTNTIKSHVKNIYLKLNVRNRTQAAKRLRETR